MWSTSLVYLNNRHYDPTIGVFTSVDPLVTTTIQPYIYGAANPVTYSDPTGESPCAFSVCPDGIPVVHNDQPDHRSWVWPILEERAMPTDGSRAGRTRDFERRRDQHDAWLGAHEGQPLTPWGLHFVVSYASPEDLARAAARGRDNGFTFGLSTGFCIFFCLEAGISSEGLYARPGIGFAVDAPGVVFDTQEPGCGSSETNAYGSLSVFGIQVSAGGVSPGNSSEWSGYGPAFTGQNLPDGGATPRAGIFGGGVGVVHDWTFC